MIKIENLETPSVTWWQTVVSGMRNAYSSWDKNDSHICYGQYEWRDNYSESCKKCPNYEIEWVNPDDEYDRDDCCNYYDGDEGFPTFVLGPNDLRLFLNLCSAGDPSHRKILRQLPVIMDITAPEYWWRQLDTYKVGTVANSTSQMHTLLKREFTLDDFSFEVLNLTDAGKAYVDNILETLNGLREAYYNDDYKLTKDALWFQILEVMPQSYNYKRTWSANYEVLLTIIKQRLGHRLPEWHDFIVDLLHYVPYLKEIAIAVGLIRERKNKIEWYDEKHDAWFVLPLKMVTQYE